MSKKSDEKPALVPRLRFPQFRDGWGLVMVGDFFDLTDKPEKTTTFDKDKVLTVKLHANGIVKNEKTTLTGGANYFNRRAGQFIFSKIDLLNGAFGVVPDTLDGFASSSDVPAYSFNAKQSSTFFVKWLKSNYERLEIERTGTSSTLKRVSPERFLTLAVPAPTVAEQQKIANCLSSLDELIAAETQKLDALKTHKKGLMQQLFPRAGETVPRLRFPEFREAGEWEISSLGDVFETTSGGTPSRSDASYWDGDIPWITTSLMNVGVITEAEEFISEDGLNNSSAKLLPKGTVLIAMYGQGKTRGQVALLSVEAATNQACAALLPKDGINPYFVFVNLNGQYEAFRKLSNSGGQENLSQALIRDFPFACPLDEAEQQRIADCLSSLDGLITAQSQKIDALKTHKKSLMQQLFPVLEEAQA